MRRESRLQLAREGQGRASVSRQPARRDIAPGSRPPWPASIAIIWRTRLGAGFSCGSGTGSAEGTLVVPASPAGKDETGRTVDKNADCDTGARSRISRWVNWRVRVLLQQIRLLHTASGLVEVEHDAGSVRPELNRIGAAPSPRGRWFGLAPLHPSLSAIRSITTRSGFAREKTLELHRIGQIPRPVGVVPAYLADPYVRDRGCGLRTGSHNRSKQRCERRRRDPVPPQSHCLLRHMPALPFLPVPAIALLHTGSSRVSATPVVLFSLRHNEGATGMARNGGATATGRTRRSRAESRTRRELAACYRMFYRRGMDDLIYTHLSVRIPDRRDRYLFIGFGQLFDDVTASSLMTVDIEGRQRW